MLRRRYLGPAGALYHSEAVPCRRRRWASDDPLRGASPGGRDGYTHAAREDLLVLSASPTAVVLEVGGVRSHYDGVKSSARLGSTRERFLDGPLSSVRLREVPRFVDPADVVVQGSLLAPMPGTVIVLEAMKMQHTITAPSDGLLELAVSVGSQVAAGDVLGVVTPSEPGTADTEGAPA